MLGLAVALALPAGLVANREVNGAATTDMA